MINFSQKACYHLFQSALNFLFFWLDCYRVVLIRFVIINTRPYDEYFIAIPCDVGQERSKLRPAVVRYRSNKKYKSKKKVVSFKKRKQVN